MTQKEYDEYMKDLADQLKTVTSELDTAFDDVKSEFSKPSYLDSYFGLQDNEHDINIHENVSSEQMEVTVIVTQIMGNIFICVVPIFSSTPLLSILCDFSKNFKGTFF